MDTNTDQCAATAAFEQAWGNAPFTALGHFNVPAILIEYGGKVGLDLRESGFIMRMMYSESCSERSGVSFMDSLCQGTGKGPRTIQRRLKSLVAKGFLLISKRYTPDGKQCNTVYDFAPLRAKLNAAFAADTASQSVIERSF